jgi:hypothetical protein
MCDEYSSVKPGIPMTQELEPVVVLRSQVDDEGLLVRENQPMHPDKVMEDPPCGWRLGRLTLLVWQRCSMVLECGANTVL